MAGTIPGFSLAQQLDSNGTPMVGCKLYTYQAGTTSTPQTAYQDSGLTLPLPFPILGDAYGRLPQIFLADGSIKLRLTKANGNQVFVLDGVLVVGASSGGGGGSPVDPTTVLQTGWLQPVYGTGIISGFVRANGRTIGSVTSGATERANADTAALFTFLYNQDVNLAVSGGRGANAAADYAANKTIALPDWRGRALAFLDDMGNSAAGRLSASYFGATATVLGAAGGSENLALSLAQLPTGIVSGGLNAITVAGPGAGFIYGNGIINSLGPGATAAPSGGSLRNDWSFNGINSISVTSSNTSGAAHRTVQPTMLATIYVKL